MNQKCVFLRALHSVAACAILAVTLSGTTAIAETKFSDSTRPKIGLVLGGGGARGAAHVGVLRVLEEHKIPIDYIAGTSMGAIVGAAYASGMSPDEIETVLTSIDWADLFTDSSPRKDLSFRRKIEQRKLLPAEMGFKDGTIALPRGALAGRKLEFILESKFLHVATIDDFDRLPIPFRAIATNIENGKPVSLGKGSLPAAIRASMSIPGAFSPMHINNQLVDGYVSMNVPVEIVRQMGADIVIAVDVGTPLNKVEDLTTLFSVLNQVGGIATQKNVEEQVKLLSPKDILIVPNLGTYAVTDFEDVKEIIPLGYQAAKEKNGELSLLGQSEPRYAAFLKKQRQLHYPELRIDTIVVKPGSRVPDATILAQMGTKPGQTLDLEVLRQDMNSIYALNAFQRVAYNIERTSGENVLVIIAEDKAWGPNYLRTGLQFNNDFSGDANYNLLADYTKTWVNSLGAEWKNQVEFGRTLMLFSEFYQPLDYEQHFFIAPSAQLKQDLRNIYLNGDRIAEYQKKTADVTIQAGTIFSSVAEARIGLTRGILKAKPKVGVSSFPNIEVSSGAVLASYTYDDADNAYFPRDGSRVDLGYIGESSALGADTTYDRFSLNLQHNISLGRHTFIGSLKGGVNPGDDSPYSDSFVLGGFLNLSGMHQDELVGQQMALGRVIYICQLDRALVSFVKSSYLGTSLENGNVWQQTSDIRLNDSITAGSIFFAADTLLGPVYLGYGLSEKHQSGMFYFSLGQRF